MSNMTKTQSNDIEAFWQLEDAKKKILAAVQKVMVTAQERYHAEVREWGAVEHVSLGVDMVEKLKLWATVRMSALAERLHGRAATWRISGLAYRYGDDLRLELNAYRFRDDDIFEDIDALIEECFDD